MKTIKKISKTFIGILLAGFMLISCEKDPIEASRLAVRMKDAPGAYEEVNVEVTEVRVHTAQHGWINVPVKDSVYNLLLLRDSISTALGITVVPAGKISQVRLILGSNNTVKVGGVIFPLTLSSQDETGLKLNVHKDIYPGLFYVMILDFDANASIVQEGDGSYRLKPVLSVAF